MAELVVIRHGHADGNSRHRFLGWSDVSLDSSGVAEAEAVADRLVGSRIDRIVTSDLVRTRQTADIVAGRLGLLAETDTRLREIDNGAWTFLLPTEIRDGWPELWEAYTSGHDVARPKGERWVDVAYRVTNTLAELLAGAGRIAVVTHGGPVTVGAAWALGISLPGNIFQGPLSLPANGSMTTIAPGPKLVGYNDVGHLGGVAETTVPYEPVE